MKTIVLFIAMLLCVASHSYAQLIAKDSTGMMAVNLEEITIKSQAVIEKDDRKVILPTRQQLKVSANGVDLLGKLQLPRIMTDVNSGEITHAGHGEVQLRINGVEVTYTEILALNPDNILRIEFLDIPGARYGNAAAVINYVTKTPKAGGNINGGAFHGFGNKRTSIEDMFAGRYNQGKSEFSANVRYLQRKGNWIREYDEHLIYPDNDLHRLEVGDPTLFNKKLLNTNISYSLQDKGRYLFNVQLRYTLQDNPAGYEDRKSRIYTSESATPVSITDHTQERNHLPAIDLYYQRFLKHDQQLIFNVVGTYIHSSNSRSYLEQKEETTETALYSNVSGKKYSLIAEGIYEKKAGQGAITAGLKHLQAFTSNLYRSSSPTNILMHQAESYAYTEYKGKLSNWGYAANLTFSRFYYSQKGNCNEQYALQPSLLVSYTPANDLHLRYHINMKNNVPSIAYLNDIEQEIDHLQIRKGNPTLKSFRSIMQDFNATYTLGIFNLDAFVTYTRERKPIMESVQYNDGLFIHTYENQKSFQHLAAEVTLKVKPWKDFISLAITPGINRYISEGNNYLHTYTLKELRINLDASYKNWMVNFMTMTPPNRLVYGEQLMKGDLMRSLMIGYKQPSWSIMAGVFNPFTKTYRSENENWSALNPVKSDIHTTTLSNTFVVKLNFNLNFGKQFKGSRKNILNSDDETGILQGTKE